MIVVINENWARGQASSLSAGIDRASQAESQGALVLLADQPLIERPSIEKLLDEFDNVNRIVMGEDLPEIVIMDDGYKNDSGTFTKFIADNKTVVMGTRNAGDRIGEYRMTRNMVNPNGAPGHYEFIKDYIRGINAPKEVPPKIEVHAGHTGGPVVFRPNAIVILTTT